MSQTQCFPYFTISVFTEWIQISSEWSWKHYRILQYSKWSQVKSKKKCFGYEFNVCVLYFLFFKGHQSFLQRTSVLLWGHWYTCFGLLVTSALGFNTRMEPLTCMLHRLCTMDTTDSPLVWHLLTSWWPSHFDPHTYTCRSIGGAQVCLCDKTDALPTELCRLGEFNVWSRRHILTLTFCWILIWGQEKVKQVLSTCGMMVNFDLRSWRPRSDTLIPSMEMYPPAASMMRNNARAKEDLPAPVLPTIPIFSPGLTEQVNSFKTKSSPGLYRVS